MPIPIVSKAKSAAVLNEADRNALEMALVYGPILCNGSPNLTLGQLNGIFYEVSNTTKHLDVWMMPLDALLVAFGLSSSGS